MVVSMQLAAGLSFDTLSFFGFALRFAAFLISVEKCCALQIANPPGVELLSFVRVFLFLNVAVVSPTTHFRPLFERRYCCTQRIVCYSFRYILLFLLVSIYSNLPLHNRCTT